MPHGLGPKGQERAAGHVSVCGLRRKMRCTVVIGVPGASESLASRQGLEPPVCNISIPSTHCCHCLFALHLQVASHRIRVDEPLRDTAALVC